MRSIRISKFAFGAVLALISTQANPAQAIEKAPPVESYALMNVIASKPPGEPHMRKGDHFRGLKLTDSQMEQIVEVKMRSEKEIVPLHVELKQLRYELGKTLTESEVNREKALSLNSKISQLMSDLSSKKIEEMIAISAVLNEEQKGKLRHKLLKHEMAGPGPGFGFGFGPPPPPPPMGGFEMRPPGPPGSSPHSRPPGPPAP